ncbi:PhoH family protein [Vibrio phage RYC]|nr:PhoH family protein [Vibrio phage RYC]
MVKKFVIDTNVLINDPQSILKFEENDVVIPLTVLEELDNQKSSDREIARDARAAIRQIDALVKDNADKAHTGIDLPTGGKLYVLPNVKESDAQLIEATCNDDHIINLAMDLQLNSDSILVSNDVCMRLKAIGLGVKEVQEFRSDVVLDDPDLLPQGFVYIPDGWLNTLEVGEEIVAKSKGETHILESKLQEILEEGDSLAINDWIINEDDKVTARLDAVEEGWLVFTFVNTDQLLSRNAVSIRPRDIFQGIVMDALLDQEIDIVVIDGAAGSGKTLLAMAAATEMVKGKKASYRMSEIIFSRSNDTQFKEIGFLKGGETEKMAPWLAGCTDNMEIIARESKQQKFQPSKAINWDNGDDEAFIQFKSLNFMRGRSINHRVFILDEAQNLTAPQMKTILSRAGEYCKVIVMGNLSQIDNDFVSPRTSGLTYATEKLHGQSFAKVLRLQGVERSRLAEFVEENF